MIKKTSKYIIFCIVFTLLLPISCKNSNSEGREGTLVIKEIQLVEIPSMITDPESRSKYASEHFWDNFDFNDSTYLADKYKMANHLATYLQILSLTTQEIAEKSLTDFTTKFTRGDATLRSFFLEEAQNILYDPNSMERNEALYISFLKNITASRNIDDITKEKYRFQLELALKNRPGATAIDFQYIDDTGRVSSLHKTNGEYILLFFFEPGCSACKDIKSGILESPTFKDIGDRLTYLAVYTGEDYNAWKESITEYPPGWITAHDMEQELVNNNLYDLRASPTMYLLDSRYQVLLKDPDLFQLNNYLSALR